MKKLLLLSFLVPVFFSCNKASSPKETAEAFIKALSTSDLATAASLTSNSTKAVLDKAKKETKNLLQPEESFQFSSLSEIVNDNKAEVKNEVVAIPLVKEEDGWKVALNESLLSDIQGREEMLASAKAKWDALTKEYDARLQTLKEYINYKKDAGALSPKVSLLNNAVSNVAGEKEWTKEKLSAYAQKQRQLGKVIDEALEPSLAANTDLSLNYFVQISNAGDRIKAAESEYQAVAEKAHSPVYIPLPFNTTNTVKVNNN